MVQHARDMDGIMMHHVAFLGDGRAHSCGRPQLEEFVDVSPESESRVNPLLFCAVLDVLGICRIHLEQILSRMHQSVHGCDLV